MAANDSRSSASRGSTGHVKYLCFPALLRITTEEKEEQEEKEVEERDETKEPLTRTALKGALLSLSHGTLTSNLDRQVINL